jgi:hypothetical protein
MWPGHGPELRAATLQRLPHAVDPVRHQRQGSAVTYWLVTGQSDEETLNALHAEKVAAILRQERAYRVAQIAATLQAGDRANPAGIPFDRTARKYVVDAREILAEAETAEGV